MTIELEHGYVKRIVPEWKPMTGSEKKPELYLYNSLTRHKELFKPVTGNQVKFYICGPTVYDSTHLGHARTFLSLDIVRRVLTNYFNYDVLFVMNMTDIDDKIIKRARQNYLFDHYVAKTCKNFNQIAKDLSSALILFKEQYEAETEMDKKQMLDKMIVKTNEVVKSVEKELQAKKGATSDDHIGLLLNSARDILSEWLDANLGKTVSDHAIFDKLAKKYENEFHHDMSSLYVLPPHVLTRVSEYVPEIVAYVERIIKHGYAYKTSDGSIYFDTVSFESNPKHFYAKLVPEAYGDTENAHKHLKESEGELSMGTDRLQEKKNPSDFALWKSSKEGEPFWDSPWGKGRPGWHIECSAMNSAVLGEKLDIHGGGYDLKFPHHDNEIALCEAYLDNENWVNYFLHAGTLKIAGLKMSKSLKNFITIRQALETYTARQLRILFLMHTWSEILDYSDQAMEQALQFEKFCNEFFLTVKNYLRRAQSQCSDEASSYQKFEAEELQRLEKFLSIKQEIHAALCDSVDTRTVIEKLREMVKMGNEYIRDKEKQNVIPNCNFLRNLAEYVTSILKVFGTIPESSQIGFPTETSESIDNKEELVMPYFNALAEFREAIRNLAIEAKNNNILAECDRLRDEILPELGVRLEDRKNQTCVKLVDRETLRREQEQKKAFEAAKQAEKLHLQKEREEKEAAKEAAKRIPPEEIFRQPNEAEKYLKFDEKGIPTHTADGEEISKKQRKKLEAAWEKQQKLYEQTMKNGYAGMNGHSKQNGTMNGH
uniref:Cysteine--tRNA ligase, cytoplasmic n=1 Tax=Acrobeloides nanus TaxID=290746 RepID=A0A914CL90_9BILA